MSHCVGDERMEVTVFMRSEDTCAAQKVGEAVHGVVVPDGDGAPLENLGAKREPGIAHVSAAERTHPH